jgi:hypothetical protein
VIVLGNEEICYSSLLIDKDKFTVFLYYRRGAFPLILSDRKNQSNIRKDFFFIVRAKHRVAFVNWWKRLVNHLMAKWTLCWMYYCKRKERLFLTSDWLFVQPMTIEFCSYSLSSSTNMWCAFIFIFLLNCDEARIN